MSVRDMVVEFNEKGFKQLQAKIEKLEKSLEKTKNKANSMSKAFSKMGKVIGGLAIAGTIYKIAKSFKSWVGAIGDMDDKLKSTGLGAELFQTVAYKMKEMGLNAEGLTTAMAKFNKVSADNKDTRSADERLMSLADHLKSIKDPAKRSAEAMKYLGKSGAQLIPIFMDGAKGVSELTKMLKDNGSILSQDTINRAMKVDDAFDKIGQTMDAIKNNFFISMLEDTNEETGKLTVLMKELSETDLSPLTKQITKMVSLLVKAGMNLNSLFDRLGTDENNFEQQVKRDMEHLAENPNLMKEYESGSDTEKEAVNRLFKNKSWSDAMFPQWAGDREMRPEVYAQTNKKFIEDIKFGIQSGFEISKEDIKRLQDIQSPKTQVPAEQRKIAKALLESIGQSFLPEVEKKAVSTTKGVAGNYSVKDKKGGSTSSGIGGGVETISVLMHFKNEFTVFARKLLKLQERGTTYGGQQIRDNRAITLSVNVTANNKSGKELGDEVAKSISKSLKDILNTNTSIIQSIKQHEETVKEITKDDGKTASIRPSSEPVPNPMA